MCTLSRIDTIGAKGASLFAEWLKNINEKWEMDTRAYRKVLYHPNPVGGREGSEAFKEIINLKISFLGNNLFQYQHQTPGF